MQTFFPDRGWADSRPIVLIHFVDTFTGEFLRQSSNVRVVRKVMAAILVIIVV
jgi:hypothetical protein